MNGVSLFQQRVPRPVAWLVDGLHADASEVVQFYFYPWHNVGAAGFSSSVVCFLPSCVFVVIFVIFYVEMLDFGFFAMRSFCAETPNYVSFAMLVPFYAVLLGCAFSR